MNAHTNQGIFSASAPGSNPEHASSCGRPTVDCSLLPPLSEQSFTEIHRAIGGMRAVSQMLDMLSEDSRMLVEVDGWDLADLFLSLSDQLSAAMGRRAQCSHAQKGGSHEHSQPAAQRRPRLLPPAG